MKMRRKGLRSRMAGREDFDLENKLNEHYLKNFDCCTVHFEDSLSIAHQQMH
jgi:hypothetical protein